MVVLQLRIIFLFIITLHDGTMTHQVKIEFPFQRRAQEGAEPWAIPAVLIQDVCAYSFV